MVENGEAVLAWLENQESPPGPHKKLFLVSSLAFVLTFFIFLDSLHCSLVSIKINLLYYVLFPEEPVPSPYPSEFLVLPMDCSPPGFSVYGILQARILEWVAISFSEGLSQPRNYLVSCIEGRFFTIWATREALVIFTCHYLEISFFWSPAQ